MACNPQCPIPALQSQVQIHEPNAEYWKTLYYTTYAIAESTRSRLQAQESQVAGLQQSLKQYERAAEYYEELLSEYEGDLDYLEDRCEAKTAEVRSLQKALEQRNKHIRALKSEMSETTKHRDSGQATIAALRANVVNLNGALRTMSEKNSRLLDEKNKVIENLLAKLRDRDTEPPERPQPHTRYHGEHVVGENSNAIGTGEVNNDVDIVHSKQEQDELCDPVHDDPYSAGYRQEESHPELANGLEENTHRDDSAADQRRTAESGVATGGNHSEESSAISQSRVSATKRKMTSPTLPERPAKVLVIARVIARAVD